MVFKVKFKDKKTKARVGVIETKKGPIETPFFMPVATKMSVKFISTEDLKGMNVPAVISNSYILSLKPGKKLIKKMGGIGKLMNFQGINATDSGGFQMYSKRTFIATNEKGVWFRNPYNGKKLYMTPEDSMQLQLDLNPDIAMCLDSMPLIENSKEQIKEAVIKTTAWAKRCKKEHDLLQKKRKKNERQLLFGIIQGGIHADLRKKSAEELKKVNFDGYSIGGLALGEPKEEEYKMIEVVKKVIDENKPIYLMGAGHPIEILEAISRGVDMFDSRFATQNARRGTILTWKGRLKLFNKKYSVDRKPLDVDCDCLVCKTYSRAYLRYLLMEEEGNAKRLVSYHNIYFITKMIEKAKEEIRKGKFKEFLKKMNKFYSKAEEKIDKNRMNMNED